MTRRLWPALALAAALALSPAPARSAPSREEVDAILSLPWNRLESYSFDPATPLDSRIGPCPPELLQGLRDEDGRPDYEDYAPTAAELKLFRDTVAVLPAGIRRVLQTRLLGLHFVRNFTGSGLTSWVPGGSRGSHVWMVLNSSLFRTSLSDTLTARERSPFKGDAMLRVDLGGEYKGLLYALLHEGTHAVDYVSGITPYTEELVPVALRREDRLKASWDVWKTYRLPRKAADFPLRDKLRFFGLGTGPLLAAKDAPRLFKGLAGSPFPSAYAARSWAEDAADLATFYHLTVVMKLPYFITVGAGPKTLRLEPMRSPAVRKRAERVYRRIEN